MSVLDLFELKDDVALVTGAGQGIGKAIAIAFSEAGSNVIVADINKNSGQETVNEIMEIGRKAIYMPVNLENYEEIEEMVGKAIKHFGKIDILANVAGINKRIPALEMSQKDWRDVLRIDLDAVFLCCQLVGREMIKQRRGVIINIASMSASIINKGITQVAYGAAKAGVVNLTKALAVEWTNYNIRVNSISPGMVLTPLVENDFVKNSEMKDFVIESTPMRRFAQPKEIASTAVFLASKASSFMTGHDLIIDGGYTVW
jgi:NAD(P)-dependent dehydrogenase (short-subunit alcohol dehydrogenase family)